MIKVGIIGGSGYTAGELLRLLLAHPKAQIDFIYSTTNAGTPVATVHQDLFGEITTDFTNKINSDVDIVFLCLGHGRSKGFLKKHTFSVNTRIIDLSNDFRLHKDSTLNSNNFVYGLPELNKEQIKTSRYIANPGCFATAIQLALLPLAKSGLLRDTIHINATTGSTGAGVLPSATSHHPWRAGNMSHYKAFEHQHLEEVTQNIMQMQGDFSQEILLITNRGDFTRGIFTTLYTTVNISFSEVEHLYNTYYSDEPYVYVTSSEINLKMAVQTNKCILSIIQKGKYLLITAILDNLLKGASGQAVQNMNLLFGYDETMGLKLKPIGF